MILPELGKFDPTTFWRDAVTYQATYYTAVPTIHLMLLARADEDYPRENPPPLRFIRSCSAPLAPATLEKLERTFGVPVLEAYAMSECNQMCASPLPRRGPRKAGTVGPSSGFIEVCILNRDLEEVAKGVKGEICVRGPSVTLGYQNNEKANREAFAGGWFHTGDEGVKDEDGYITVTGRIKERINRGGEKISPNEVDNALMSCSFVAEAVSFGAPDELYGQCVACAVRLNPEGVSKFGDDTLAITAAIRKHVGERLSDYKVPTYVFVAESIPKNATGKVQRRHVAQHFLDKMKESGSIPRVAAGQNSEDIVRNIWMDVLGCAPEGDDSDFFVMGGNSVRAMQGVSRLCEYTGLNVPATFVIQYRTFGRLIQEIDCLRGSNQAKESIPLTSLLFARNIPRHEGVETSRNQEHMLLLYEQDPLRTDYLVVEADWLEGEVNAGALHSAYEALVARHESLRTIFKRQGTGLQQVVLKDFKPQWSYHDFCLGANEFEKALELLRMDMNTPFNLYKEAPISAHLICCTDNEYMFYIKTHHICFDGWSRGVMVKELSSLYVAMVNGESPKISNIEIQYADYSAWQRSEEFSNSMKGSSEFWAKTLEGATPLLEVPSDYPRPSIPSGEGSCVPIHIPSSVMEKVRHVSKYAKTTPFVFLSTCFQLLLGRLAGETDVVIGTPSAGRDARALEPLIGFLVSPIPLRIQINQKSFKDLLEKAGEMAADAREHNRLPLQDIIVAANVERNASYSPLYQNVFVLQDENFKSELNFPNIEVKRLGEEEYLENAMFDLTLELIEMADKSLTGSLKFSTDLYRFETAHQIVNCYLRVVDCALNNPHMDPMTFELVDEKLRTKILSEFSKGEVTEPDTRVNMLAYDSFEKVARENGATPCLLEAKTRETLTYHQVSMRSNGIALKLLDTGICVGSDVVGVLLSRSNALCVCMLGVMKSGAAYATLDSSLPEERLLFMIEASNMKVILADTELISPELHDALALRNVKVISSLDWQSLETSGGKIMRGEVSLPRCRPSDNAFLNFTSGSTGKPKGATITHASTVNFVAYTIKSMKICKDDAMMIKSATSFDAFPGEVMTSFSTGSLGVVLAPEALKDVNLVLDAFSLSQRPFHLFGLVPTVANLYLSDPTFRSFNIASAVLGGEVVSPTLFNSMLDTFPGITVINAYGPCECGNYVVANTSGECTDNTFPIGRPIPNANIYLCDEHLNLVPINVPGEICVSGPCVGNGYIGQPGLTAEKFVRNPFSNDPEHAVLYRTGDLGKWNHEKNIEFVGRVDNMVKIRGLRIELAEIETVIGSAEGVDDIIVSVRMDKTGSERLVAYISPQGQDEEAILSAARLLLPSYMVPSLIVQMDSLPKLVSGKVNRKQLPMPDWDTVRSAVYVEPSSVLEKELQRLWEEVLGLSPLSVEDDFFSVGGSSLLAMSLTSKMRRDFEIDLPGSHIFQFRTVRQMADAILQQPHAESPLFEDSLDSFNLDYSQRLDVSLQEELYCRLNEVNPKSTAESLLFSFHIKGQIDIDALQTGLNAVCRRHTALRTRFGKSDGSIYRETRNAEGYNCLLKVVDVREAPNTAAKPMETSSRALKRQPSRFNAGLTTRSLLQTHGDKKGKVSKTATKMQLLMRRQSTKAIQIFAEDGEGETEEVAQLWEQYSEMADIPKHVLKVMHHEAAKPFNLIGGNLVRVYIFMISDEESVMLMNIQHAISDGWTFGVIFTELNHFYKEAKNGAFDLHSLPQAIVQYPQFAARQRKMYDTGKMSKGIEFWRSELDGSQEEIPYPFDRQRPQVSSYLGHTVRVVIPAASVLKLQILAKNLGATFTTTALTTWRIALHGLSGANDFCIGWAMGNRDDESLANTVGCISNLAAIRTKVDPSKSFEDAVKQENSSVLRATDYSYIPWLAIVRDAGKDWGKGPHPIFGGRISILDMAGLAKGGLDLEGCTCREFTRKAFMHTSKYNLELEMQITPDNQLVGTLEYSTDMFNRSTVTKIADNLQTLFQTVAEKPGTLVKDMAAIMHSG